jgi:hypothetical protein
VIWLSAAIRGDAEPRVGDYIEEISKKTGRPRIVEVVKAIEDDDESESPQLTAGAGALGTSQCPEELGADIYDTARHSR